MKDAANGGLKLDSLRLAYAPLEIRVFLDYMSEDSERVALPELILDVAGGLDEAEDVVPLDDPREGHLVLAQFGEYGVRVQGRLEVVPVLRGDLLDERGDDVLPLRGQDVMHRLLLRRESVLPILVILGLLLAVVGLGVEV